MFGPCPTGAVTFDASPPDDRDSVHVDVVAAAGTGDVSNGPAVAFDATVKVALAEPTIVCPAGVSDARMPL